MNSCYRFPFDTNTPIGFTVAIILLYVAILNNCATVACGSSLLIGSYVFLVSLTRDIKCKLLSANENLKIENDQTLISKHVTDIIDLHCKAKELS